ncbi:copper homeostasis protein CutC [Acidaminobacter sp. JC074]|uniref:copper homeostasis protein CutC n=1 Tax=Acidaminobacter sp. JC074 TaxID=2530199 RepID=UPI001F10BA02|nr:copper homeostasis protein CutC [Acidaminobacter sp. JC074]MCH4886787.1 copper homeostasis protein CutC [Acidaminobacter sp. JC074]
MLEVIAQSVEDAKAIELGGADRIELVSAISVGGLTPSYAMVEEVVKAVYIPVNVMIRPHGYHFNYKTDELKVMKRDMELLQDLGINGFVLGVLDGKKVDTRALEYLLENIKCQVTFHRAIDETNVVESFKALSKIDKITQILTSGGPGKAYDHQDILDQLYEIAPEKLLLGSGITINNMSDLLEKYPQAGYHIGSDARVNQTFSNRIDENHIRMIVDLMK